jgi:hypothetical protein
MSKHTVTLLFFPCSQVIYKFNNDFFSLAPRRSHNCCLESAATCSLKKADCPEFRRMIQRGILNEMFIHPRRKKIESKISLMDPKGPNNNNKIDRNP